MNEERIREIADQCGFKINAHIYDRNQPFDILKFTELVVNECTAIVVRLSPDRPYMVRMIKEHFGIEE
jgi:hypothetical protein